MPFGLSTPAPIQRAGVALVCHFVFGRYLVVHANPGVLQKVI
jgi:hypothetical protein